MSCNQCSKSFSDSKSLQRHIKYAHNVTEEEKKCSFCYKILSSPISKEKHQKICKVGKTRIWDSSMGNIEVNVVEPHLKKGKIRHAPFIRKSAKSEFQLNILQDFEYWLVHRSTVNSPEIEEITKKKYVRQFAKILDFFEVFISYLFIFIILIKIRTKNQ